MKLTEKFDHFSCRVNVFLINHFAGVVLFLGFVALLMTIIISFATCVLYYKVNAEELLLCQCITNHESRRKFSKYLNQTCPQLPVDLQCFMNIDEPDLFCINMANWRFIWRLVLNVEALLNIVIAMVIWRSPYLPNVISVFCCVSTILSSYTDNKWFALAGELMTFVGTYAMLYFGLISKIKIS